MHDNQQNIAEPKDIEEISFSLSDEEIREITNAVHAQDADTVHEALRELSAPDTADLIAKVNDEDREELLSMFGGEIDPVVYTEMDTELIRTTLSAMPAAQVAGILKELETDDALGLIETLDESFQKEIIRKLSAKTRAVIEEGLSFPEDSAGRLMQREVVAVPEFWTVGKTIDYLRKAADDLPENFFDVFVIDPAYHIKGHIPLNRIIRSPRSQKMDGLTLDETITISAEMDQEDVARLFRREDIVSAPVIDDAGRLIGVITIDDVVDVIDQEASEDILKLAGVTEGDLYRAILSTTGIRFRWLFVNLLTAILASVVISFFDATISELVALAVLMPIVASMGGNAGTQALTVAVRALATKELSGANTARIIWKETAVGSLNGAAFALITGALTALWFANPMLGLVIAIAMVINLFAAGLFGAGIPIVLDRYGADPAVASTVFLTTITDVVGFFAFLGLAAILLI